MTVKWGIFEFLYLQHSKYHLLLVFALNDKFQPWFDATLSSHGVVVFFSPCISTRSSIRHTRQYTCTYVHMYICTYVWLWWIITRHFDALGFVFNRNYCLIIQSLKLISSICNKSLLIAENIFFLHEKYQSVHILYFPCLFWESYTHAHART